MYSYFAWIIAAVCAYFLGNINPAILIGKAKGIDIRAQGSGNAGATNAMRSLGKKEGALVFGIDVVKGWAGYFVPSLIIVRIIGGDTTAYFSAMLCGLCVVLGHMYPAIFGFKGGKGVATTFGVLLAASWQYALILFGIVIVFTLIFKRVSLSVMIAVAAAVILFILGIPSNAILMSPLWTMLILALVVWKHRGNIKRLVKGEEPPLDLSFLSRRKSK